MSLYRTLLVFRNDYTLNTRRLSFWIWAFVLAFFAYGLSSGAVRIQSGDSSIGGTKSFYTSEFAFSQHLMILIALIYTFFVSVVSGMSIIQDDEHRFGEILHATPLRPSEYISGKFLAVIAVMISVAAIHISVTMVCNHVLPPGASLEFRGPFQLSNYLRPFLIFGLPTLIFYAGLTFAVGEFTRKPILVYLLPVASLLGSIFFLWEWSPGWLDPKINQFLMLIDPAGLRWFQETLTKVDRGVSFYNNESVPLDSLIIANRLFFLSSGLSLVAFSRRHFTRGLRSISKRAERDWKKGNTLTAAARRTVVAELKTLPQLRMTSRPPGLMTGAWNVFLAELTELRSSPGFYLFIPLLVVQAVGPSIVATGPFDTSLLLTSGSFAVASMNQLTTLLCMLSLFYIVESLWRERNTRFAAISFATPIRTGSILIGKTLANATIAVIVLTLMFSISAVWMAYEGKVRITILPFVLVWGLLLIPTFLLWTSFVIMTLSMTRQRFVTYAIAIGVLAFTGYRQITGKINWVGNWPLWSAVRWSDISILEFDRQALILNRVMALGLSVLFTIVTTKCYPRQDLDLTALAGRFRPKLVMRAGLMLLPFILVPLISGWVLSAKVDNGFQGEASKKILKDYWRKNIATYRDWPDPDITEVDLTVDLEPKTSSLAVQGTYDLENNENKHLTQLLVSGGLHWEDPKWSIDGRDVKPDNRAGLNVFKLDPPLRTGGSLKLGFSFHGTFPKGITSKGGGNNEFILPSGVVLTSFGTSFAPWLGFNAEVGVDEENRSESKEYPDDFYVGRTESGFGSIRPYTTKIKITGPDNLSYNSVGTLQSEQSSNGRKTAIWQSDQPVNFFNIVAGNWEVRRGEGTAIYFDKRHPYNIDEMSQALDSARKYYSEWFRPYPWKELKLSEFPNLASYAQGFPTDITFSESIGFLTKNDDESDATFMVTAHEAAHQWWGNLIAPGKGPGGNLLSEGTAHFSTLLLFEQVRGAHARMGFAKKIEDTYNNTRSADSERPLVKTDGTRNGDQSVTYDKTGWVLWMLLNQTGRTQMMAGLAEFFQVYDGNPDHPVLQDLLEVLRKHSDDPKAFDAFTHQWFYEVVVPEYKFSDQEKKKVGESWVTTATLKNVGTSTMPVEVAATRKVRFPKALEGIVAPDYQENRQTVTLGADESLKIQWKTDFEPDALLVDPDVKVLMLRRRSAIVKF